MEKILRTLVRDRQLTAAKGWLQELDIWEQDS